MDLTCSLFFQFYSYIINKNVSIFHEYFLSEPLISFCKLPIIHKYHNKNLLTNDTFCGHNYYSYAKQSIQLHEHYLNAFQNYPNVQPYTNIINKKIDSFHDCVLCASLDGSCMKPIYYI